jgi:polysaccharide export outer membrane protein
MSALRFLVLRTGSLLACAVAFVSAAMPAPARAQTAAANAETRKLLIYRIRTSDRLRISVYQEDDLSTLCTVDAKGTVNLNLVKEIKIVGDTLSEAERTIEAAYTKGRFLVHPAVTITVDEYASREVVIQGMVRNPGRFAMPAETTMSVLDLVTRAGGFTDTAAGTAVRVTRTLPDGSTKVFTLDIESFIKGKSKARKDDTTLLLEPDDIVYVPERII